MRLLSVALLLASLASSCHLVTGQDDLTDKRACNSGSHDVPNLAPNPDPVAPATFMVSWKTTVSSAQPIILEVYRQWSPLGVDRFYQLTKDNFFVCGAFFRFVPDFVVQFGIASQPEETAKWNTTIPDDPVLESNTYGMVSYATSGPNTRTTEIFINLANNSRLDADGFSPFAKVVEGMDVIESLYNPGNCSATTCLGIDQANYTEYGNAWVLTEYPEADLIVDQTFDTSNIGDGGVATSSSGGSAMKAMKVAGKCPFYLFTFALLLC